MHSTPGTRGGRGRKLVEDAVVFGAAAALAVSAILTMGAVGLGVGCVLLSVAAAVVVAREHGGHGITTGDRIMADGGRED